MVRAARADDLPTEMDGAVVTVFHAHPDDEAFTTAATTLALAAAGADVRLFIATGGELAELGSVPDRDETAARGTREQRLTQSCQLIGIASWSYLTRPGEWVDTTDTARTLAAAPTATVAAAVRATIDRCRPEVVLSVGPDGVTGHPDHIAMHHAVTAALRMPGWTPPHAWGAAVVDADVPAATAAIEQAAPGHDASSGRDRVSGIPTADIVTTIDSPGAAPERRQALDSYLEGLGSYSLAQLIDRYRLRGASLTLRALFDTAGWETEHLVSLRR